MINNVASLVFGFIYISLWQAVAPEISTTDPYTRQVMVSIIVLAQVFAWVAIFLPAGLGIHLWVRSGQIALEMARPVGFFPLVMAREVGNLAYQALYRSLPLALLFAVTVAFPAPASLQSLLYTIPSLLLGSYIALCITYTVGISSLWTVEIRWAHWLYHSMAGLLSGGWVPVDMLPFGIGEVARYLPFAAQIFYPARIYLGLSGPEMIWLQMGWAALLTLWCLGLTRLGLRRVIVQGG